MNQKFQNAINGIAQKTPPVWMMRQAGRYHSHYQGMRKKHSFMELCKNPDLAAEVARGPVADFDFDVSILFSDLLFPLEALGMGLKYEETGPELGWNLNPATFKNLLSVEKALPQLYFQKQAVQATRAVLPSHKSLIGFVGGPWTLYAYAVDGSHKGALTQTKALSYELFPRFCEIMVPLLIENIKLQFEGGAEIVMLFDTAAGELSPVDFTNLVMPELQKLTRSYPKKLGYYSKGTTEDHLLCLTPIKENLAGLGVDHRFSLAKLAKNKAFFNQTSQRGFFQGNFDQGLLFLGENDFKKNLDSYLQSMKEVPEELRAGWVSGLGHGVLPKTPEAHVRYFVGRVREAFA